MFVMFLPDLFSNKGAIIKALGLRGGMVWALDLDDFRGTFCGQGTWPMIKKMKSMCLGGEFHIR